MIYIRKEALLQISDDLLSIAPTLGKRVNNMLMNTLLSLTNVKLSSSHFAIMKVLNEKDERLISEVAYWLLIPQSQMTRHIDKLAGIGYVERLDNPLDRRSTKIRLTEKGKKIFQEWLDKAMSDTEYMFNSLNDEEINDMASSLSRLRRDITIYITNEKNGNKY